MQAVRCNLLDAWYPSAFEGRVGDRRHFVTQIEMQSVLSLQLLLI
jgi:hypothetical protein